MEEEFGDFEEIETTPGVKKQEIPQGFQGPTRVRMPRQGQIVGTVQQRLGGNRMDVRCSDGKTRNCRVPGRFKRSLWLRINDVVLIELWEHDSEKGDIIYKYGSSEITQLRKRGMLNEKTNDF